MLRARTADEVIAAFEGVSESYWFRHGDAPLGCETNRLGPGAPQRLGLPQVEAVLAHVGDHLVVVLL